MKKIISTRHRYSYYCLLTVIFFTFSLPTFARNYSVEVIVFTKNNTTNNVEKQKEILKTGTESPLSAAKQQKYLDILTKLNTKKTIGVYPSNHDSLNSTKKTIRLWPLSHLKKVKQDLIDSGYTILVGAGWIQAGDFYQHAPIVSLSDLNPVIKQAYIRVYKTSLIFANVNIEYTPLDNTTEVTTNYVNSRKTSSHENITVKSHKNYISDAFKKSNLLRFFISEKRRLKFKHVHYFDHPQFGVIMTVWPA